MLHKAKTLKGYKLDSLDGKIGKVREFYFDDSYWTIRYLVADTGDWLMSRQVLVSPYALVAAIENDHGIVVNLTKKQIEESPSLDTDKPVSRQFEEAFYGYYGWPAYWSDSNTWGYTPYIERDRDKWSSPHLQVKPWDPHLRSTDDVDGHHIQATDGEIGHVEDFIIDDETWNVRYLVISTMNWWPGKKILVSPHWIERVSWSESKVFVKLTRESIKRSPEFVENTALSRDYEAGLYSHYDRKGYWVDELVTQS